MQTTLPLSNKKVMRASMELYRFIDHGVHIVYCPALDLSAAGNTAAESLNEFKMVFKMHMEDCVENETLHDDLLSHGWKLQETSIYAPKATQVLSHNTMLRDIFNNHDYSKETRVMNLPRVVCQSLAMA